MQRLNNDHHLVVTTSRAVGNDFEQITSALAPLTLCPRATPEQVFPARTGRNVSCARLS